MGAVHKRRGSARDVGRKEESRRIQGYHYTRGRGRGGCIIQVCVKDRPRNLAAEYRKSLELNANAS